MLSGWSREPQSTSELEPPLQSVKVLPSIVSTPLELPVEIVNVLPPIVSAVAATGRRSAAHNATAMAAGEGGTLAPAT